jgi:hypothetical protein
MNKNGIATIFGWLTIVGPLHMIEQLIFGIDGLAKVKGVLAVYYSWFTNADWATVLLVSFAVTMWLITVYAAIKGGRWLNGVAIFFALICLAEIHHLLEAVAHGGYSPGMVTAVPFMGLGVLFLRATRVHKPTPVPAILAGFVA